MIGSKKFVKKIIVILVLCSSLVVGDLFAGANANYPTLQNGDLIFQTSASNQSSAILVATTNPYTHMGIIKSDGKNIVVIEAVGKVKETPLKEWVDRGVLKRVAIYRNPELTLEHAKQVISFARAYYGKSYDIFFSFNNDTIYCSELPYIAYKKAGISIGKVQKISELNFDNPLVKQLIEQRWQRHSECKAKKYNFEQCYDYILNQDLVTPASIAKDAQFEKIYSNYPF